MLLSTYKRPKRNREFKFNFKMFWVYSSMIKHLYSIWSPDFCSQQTNHNHRGSFSVLFMASSKAERKTNLLSPVVPLWRTVVELLCWYSIPLGVFYFFIFLFLETHLYSVTEITQLYFWLLYLLPSHFSANVHRKNWIKLEAESFLMIRKGWTGESHMLLLFLPHKISFFKWLYLCTVWHCSIGICLPSVLKCLALST